MTNKNRRWKPDRYAKFKATMAAKRAAKHLSIVDPISEVGKVMQAAAEKRNFVIEDPPYNKPRELPPEVIVYRGWFYNRKLEATVIE